MLSLREWLLQNEVYLDPRLEIEQAPTLRVIALDSIPPDHTVARIPKTLILSRRNSSLSSRFSLVAQHQLDSLSPPLQLSVHVFYELSLGAASKWAGYFEHCPRDIIDIGLLWEKEGEASRWIVGTELERELERINVDRTILSNLCTSLVLPLFSSLFPPPHFDYSHPLKDLELFCYAYSLVSSRSFQIDPNFHLLALVPFADAFNHLNPEENHVELVSGIEGEGWVCGVCGRVEECLHDREETESLPTRDVPAKREGEDDDTVEMVTTYAPVQQGEEMFNSYGALSNARLIAEYGFRLEANEHDKVTFTRDEIGEIMLEIGMDVRAEERKIEVEEESEEEEHPLIAYRNHSGTLSRGYYFDADAKISHDLWDLLVDSVSATHDSRDRRNELRDSLARLVTQEEEDEEEVITLLPEVRAALSMIAQVVQSMCRRRLQAQFQSSLTGSEVLDQAENMKDGRLKLAMEFVAEERLLLERVIENWQAALPIAIPRNEDQI
ncbi:protein-lysine N-methyltransferase [Sporobolomyces salmoneus]|uniref:protein-lysine N-methyltransferase n=1 Tax=Sporobolomyces salmoneus TaxID=183962 RepID=UPI00316CE6C4